MIINRLGLTMKFSISVALLISVAMLGSATLIISYQKESLRENIFENCIEMTQVLARDAVDPILVSDPLRLDELVKTSTGATARTFAMITDRDGRIIAHTNRSLLGTGLDRAEMPELLRAISDGTDAIREYSYGSGFVREFSYPVKIGSEVLGLATIAYSLDAIDTVIGKRLMHLKKYIYLITAIMLLTGIAGAFIVSNILIKPLTRLKSRMIDVQAGNLEVEVENRNLVECWKRLNCDRKECPSYNKLRCWARAGTFCRGEVQGAFAKKIGDCRKCVVYKESCGDEIHELVEVFNQMVKDLRHNLAELEKANAEKSKMERLSALGEMASVVAHETKNPLNAIRMATSYLKENFEGEILTEFLTIIEEEVMRLNDISMNFLGFSKPAPLKLRPYDLNTIVNSTVELIRQEATDRDIEVICLTDENLPAVNCDFPTVKQAFLNILLNALDVSGAGDSITITTEVAGPVIQVTVQDSGKGISTEEMAHIFKPFYTTKTRGSGLGLAIVDRIVKEHGGEIGIESIPGKGTKVTIRMKATEYAEA
jgi:two-component system, NtrC family, sensor histidine kinase HydH